MTQTDRALRVARGLALKAGQVHRSWLGRLDRNQVKLKGRRNPVTEADLEAEALIVAGLKQEFPDHQILAEETGAGGGDSEYCWIIDPLDGTVNFSHRLPLFCVALALVQSGEPVLSVVYLPVLEELFEAVQGGGCRMNGKAIHVSRQQSLTEALLATGFAYGRNEADDDNTAHFRNFVLRCRDLRRMGSASIDFAYLAAGRLDGYWELDLSPWDVAPGALLVEEAGGKVTELDGSPRTVRTSSMVASNGPLHAAMQDQLGFC